MRDASSRRARSRRFSRILAIPTRSDCCAASRAAASGRIAAGWTRSQASCRAWARSSAAAFSRIAARSPTTAAAPTSPRSSPSPPGTRAAAGTTSSRTTCRARKRRTSPCHRSTAAPLRCVELDELTKIFKQRGHEVHALTDVTAAIWPGETLGLVGESGSGKTTLARTLLGIVAPTAGVARLDGVRLPAALPEALAGASCARCRSCSRTRTLRSTAATRCAASCSAR